MINNNCAYIFFRCDRSRDLFNFQQWDNPPRTMSVQCPLLCYISNATWIHRKNSYISFFPNLFLDCTVRIALYIFIHIPSIRRREWKMTKKTHYGILICVNCEYWNLRKVPWDASLAEIDWHCLVRSKSDEIRRTIEVITVQTSNAQCERVQRRLFFFILMVELKTKLNKRQNRK